MSAKANYIRPLFFALFPLAMLCTTATAKVIYVDDDAIAEFDGSSWAHAYRTLQGAIAEVRPGDEIRVANGIYRPDRRISSVTGRGGVERRIEASGDRIATFELINGVIFRGGYAGYGEPDPNARNISLYETILSGDLNNNDLDVKNPEDLLNEPSRADNSHNVITTRGNVVLDGFTITGGNANTANTLQNSFSEGKNGAGLINEYGTIEITNCIFRENSTDQLGGAIYNYRGSLNLTNCTFTRNSARDNGAGIHNFQSDTKLNKCTFRENIAQFGSGGGIHNEQSNPDLTNCKFIENIAQYGGGMYNDESSSTLDKCMFIGNSAQNDGGGIYNINESNLILNNCALIGNSANDDGGGLSNNNSSPTLTNCTFTANSASNGNAISSKSERHGPNSTISLINCILWDGGNEIFNDDNSISIVSYSDVQGGRRGEGNIDAEPLFVDPLGPDNIPGTEDDNLRLAPMSPCIDSGDPDYAPEPNETDLEGKRRIIRGRIDMGAYEFQPVIYVDDDNRLGEQQDSEINHPLEDGTEQHPFNDIYKAIDAAEDGTTILVKPGLYSKIDFKGKAITIAGIEGAVVIDGTTTTRGGSIGRGEQDAVTFHTGEKSDSVLKNIVIRENGMAISLNYGSSPTITNITIVDNDFGIAAYENSNPDISNCIFWNNKDGELFQCQARYSCFSSKVEGPGNINSDPLFVDAANGDYHLKSEGWRWNMNSESWTYDDVTSPCIDAGDPDSPLGDEPMSVPRDPDNIYGINQRINMGAFGGTAQASMPPRGWVLP
jgi:parallel beta-helix repeat protein